MRYKEKNNDKKQTALDNKRKERNFLIFWIIIGLFALLLLWKIAITPFEIDFSILLTFLLALFTIGISLLFYIKVNQTLRSVKQLLDSHPVEPVEKQLLDSHPVEPVEKQAKAATSEVEMETKDDMANESVNDEGLDEFETTMSNDVQVEDSLNDEEPEEVHKYTINEATARIEAEEKTLKLKEEERNQLLEKLLHKADLDDEEKQMYITQLEKVNYDLFNLRSNLNQLRKKINSSLSEMFVLEKTKQVRDVVEKLGPEFVSSGSFADINSRFQVLKDELPESVIDLLRSNEYIDSNNNLNRKGYREFLKSAKKML
ncbi:hypothetical protein DCC39_13790 [Pueribacillus theae]|uniref:Uncharacterized protein n=1 Tax=Pueribacillus theae TaxID=2171751 RepID=A0A2U1JVR5_9BACI|nr:hypothetical protein [Pueribacillus theae]PWA09034.1 hypothetical protein DCC39_13790 [Pueribacillus theae]